MSCHIKKSKKKGTSLFYPHNNVLVLVFMMLIFCPLLSGWNDVNAQDDTGGMKADFLFQKPSKYLGFRVGIFSPEADSELFDMITEELTLEKSDFRTWDLGIDVGFSMHNRVDLVFSLDYSGETNNSEFRNYVDEEGLPITQRTKFTQRPLTAGIRYLLIPRGRQISQYSWLPSPVVPYVSGGVGVLWYEFSQHGDFVDYSTLDIFPAALDSSGGTITSYLGCGAEFNIFNSTYINLDFRYNFADDDLDRDFTGFDPIELSGYRLTTGIQWHF